MGIVAPKNLEVLDYKGIHLYHAGISNCAMRVRVTLEEKNLPWTSHHLDIMKKEHLNEDYFGINPNGVVPSLVHDGTVIIESDDIIDYLDEKFPEPPLRATTEDGRRQMYEWMKLGVNNHIPAVKTFIYYNKIQKFMRQTDEEQKKYEQLQSNDDLRDYHTKNSSGPGISQEDAARAEQILNDCFSKAEKILVDQDWLVEDRFGLADITWIPLHFTLFRAGFSFDGYPAVQDWADRISKRDSFKKGVVDWWPEGGLESGKSR